MGFERVDQIAKEIAAGRGAPGGQPPTRRASRRSTPTRWASLGLLALAGLGGAAYFVVGSSGAKPPVPRSPDGAQQSAGTAELPAVSPTGPAPELQLSAADARGARAAQIAVVLDDIDATLHGLRATWPGQLGQFEWRPASWLTTERLDRELAALDSQLVGASDPLSVRTREWVNVARADGARLLALHAAWSAPGASADALGAELRPLFDRLVVASQSMHAAVAADMPAPPPGTLASLAAACRVAPLLARLPLRGAAAGPAIVEQGGGVTPSPPMREPPIAEIRALADRCMDEARVFLAANPADQLDHHDIYQLSLANSTALNLLHEHERRRQPPDTRVFISTAANLAQQSSYLATARRQYDPTLRPAEAAPTPAVPAAPAEVPRP